MLNICFMRLFAIVVILFIDCCSLSKTPVTPSSSGEASNSDVCNFDHSAAIETELLAAGWEKKLEDNFNVSPSNNLNTNWNTWIGGAFNNELQLYTSDSSNLEVVQDPQKSSNKLLIIRAIKEKVIGPKYRQDVDATPTPFEFTSARIESKLMFAPGQGASQIRFVARIKLPGGYGMWPAFWSYGNNWPTDGEIDVLEARGNEPFQFQTNYFFGSQANVNLAKNVAAYLSTNTSLTDCWHVYEVIWTKQDLTFLLDGQVIDVKVGGYVPNLYGRLQRIAFNLAVGGDFFYKNFSRPTPSQISLNKGEGIMLVDWVKVYAKK
jgi:beta-glucanase (GH16 family)